MADIVGKPEGLFRLKECLIYETDIDTMLAEKMLQYKLPASHSAFQQAGRRALYRTVLLGRAAIFGHEEDEALQDGPRAVCPCAEGGDGREEPTGQLHPCLAGEVIEEIRYSRVGTWKFGWGPPVQGLWV